MPFKLSERSRNALIGVHPVLVGVVCRAIELTPVDFVVTEGLRSKERQLVLFNTGKSKTKNSRHLYGFAVDVAALEGGHAVWDLAHYEKIAQAFKQAAQELGAPVEWGGDFPKLFPGSTFVDAPHFQLSKTRFPDR